MGILGAVVLFLFLSLFFFFFYFSIFFLFAPPLACGPALPFPLGLVAAWMGCRPPGDLLMISLPFSLLFPHLFPSFSQPLAPPSPWSSGPAGPHAPDAPCPLLGPPWPGWMPLDPSRRPGGGGWGLVGVRRPPVGPPGPPRGQSPMGRLGGCWEPRWVGQCAKLKARFVSGLLAETVDVHICAHFDGPSNARATRPAFPVTLRGSLPSTAAWAEVRRRWLPARMTTGFALTDSRPVYRAGSGWLWRGCKQPKPLRKSGKSEM